MKTLSQQEIAAIVQRELAACPDLVNAHGLDVSNLRCYLQDPAGPQPVLDIKGEALQLWLILDELPDSATSGYLVGFEEASGEFGLAIKGGEGRPPVVIGFHATLCSVLRNM